MLRWAVTLAAMFIVGSSAVASKVAADARSCAAAHVAGQRESNAGHLRAALAQFQSCGADDGCPLPVRNECLQLFASVQEALPTIVFSVVDRRGRDITKVRVFWSEELIASELNGRPLPIDPGEQSFVFEFPSGDVVSTALLVRQGEKNRLVTIKEEPAQEAAPESDAEALKASASSAQSASPRPLVPAVATASPESMDKRSVAAIWAITGVGVVALGSWGMFGLLGARTQRSLEACAPRCDASRLSEFDAMKRNYLIADVSLGVAAASAVAIGALLLSSKKKRAQSSERPLALTPAVFPHGGGLTLRAQRY